MPQSHEIADKSPLPRRRLALGVKTMLGLLALAFVSVLLAGLFTSGDDSTDFNAAQDILSGHTQLSRVNGERLWISNINQAQLTQLLAMSDNRVYRNTGCQAKLGLCAVRARTSKQGIEIRYIAEKPFYLPPAHELAGGFVNPTTGLVYDLLGRALREQELRAKLNVDTMTTEQWQGLFVEQLL